MQFIDLKSQQARIREDIEARIQKVLDHGQYILGPEIKEMEEMLASYVEVKHCVGASSGTDTLLIALLALGIGPGDEVIHGSIYLDFDRGNDSARWGQACFCRY